MKVNASLPTEPNTLDCSDPISAPSPRPLRAVRGPRSLTLFVRRNHADAEAQNVEPVCGHGVVTERRPAACGFIEPATATVDAVRAASWPCGIVRRRLCIVALVVPILRTTPTRSRVRRITPRRWASSRQRGVSCRRSSRRTRSIRPAPPRFRRSNISSCSPPDRRIPAAPPWATETSLGSRRTSRSASPRILTPVPSYIFDWALRPSEDARVVSQHRLPQFLRYEILAKVERLGDPHAVPRLPDGSSVLI